MARHEHEERPLPAHPYRDTAIVYGIMAGILVLVAGITGGSLVRALGAGAAFWVLATAWSWWRFRGRIRERDAAKAEAASSLTPSPDPEPPGVGATDGHGSGAANGSVNGARGRKGTGRSDGGGVES